MGRRVEKVGIYPFFPSFSVEIRVILKGGTQNSHAFQRRKKSRIRGFYPDTMFSDIY
jgi:hypothetical protein